MMNQIAEKLINLLTAPIKSEGYELLEVEFNKHRSYQTVQLIIDSINEDSGIFLFPTLDGVLIIG